jgi:hypothetical protein
LQSNTAIVTSHRCPLVRPPVPKPTRPTPAQGHAACGAWAGAKEGLKFSQYVKYLADEGHIPPKATKWVDYIRNKGNDANHEIEIMAREDAERLIKFSEMLLRIMYEYPAEVQDPS